MAGCAVAASAAAFHPLMLFQGLVGTDTADVTNDEFCVARTKRCHACAMPLRLSLAGSEGDAIASLPTERIPDLLGRPPRLIR
jgi:hypothetical protein